MSLKRVLYVVGIMLFVVALVFGSYLFLHRTKKVVQKSNAAQTAEEQAEQKGTPDNQADQEAAFDKKAHSIDDPASIWVVVNKTRPLNPVQYAPTDLVAVGNAQQMRKESASALATLIAAAKAQKLSIAPLSGYRSYATQVAVYNNEVAKYGQATADSESAKPGTSEHQTGWAVDVGGGGCGIEDCFGNTAEGKWLAANAFQYGFIIRYPADKVNVTGYRAEPWHIRYIGTDLSQEMHAQGITTLEEFFGLPPYKS